MLKILFAILLFCFSAFAETPTQVDFLIGGLTNSSGNSLAGGKIYTYAAGTTTNKTTWQDAAKTTPHANPIVLDAEGKKLVFADGNYKFRIDSSADVTQYTLDNLKFGLYNGAATYAGATTGSSNTYVATLSPPLLALTNGAKIVFEANHTNTGASTLNVNGLGAIDLNRSDDVVLTASEIISGNTYSATYESSTNAWLVGGLPIVTWTSYVPTLTPSGSMTYTSTSIAYAKYFRFGKFVHYNVSFSGTVGGTPSFAINYTLPITAANTVHTAGGYVIDGGSRAGIAVFPAATTTADCSRYNSASFTAGSVTCTVSGSYEAAS